MWITPIGKRILTGKEKELFVAAASMGIDMLSELAAEGGYSPTPNAGSRWDTLHWHQQICAIGEVSKHLINNETSETNPTEWSDVTIAAIYDFIIYTNPSDFESFIIEAANEVGIKNISLNPDGGNSSTKLDKVLRFMRDRIIGKRKTKKQIIEEHGECYYTEPFPAFSMNRFINAYNLFDKAPIFGIAALPKVIKNRNDAGFENQLSDDKNACKPWYPIYNKGQIKICWK